MDKIPEQVVSLVNKAAAAHAADDALKFTQAACNAANALRVMKDMHLIAKPQ